jgi:tellurite methyltransferase
MAERDEESLWDERYAGQAHLSNAPDPFLLQAYAEHIAPAFPSPVGLRALDFAGGAGRHAIHLATLGWSVDLLDISAVGLTRAREAAARSGVTLHPIQADLASHPLPVAAYDLILVFYFLRRDLFPSLVAALRPGGYLVYRTFTTAQKDFIAGPRDPDFLLLPNELLSAFPALRVLHYRETAADHATAELIAKK